MRSIAASLALCALLATSAAAQTVSGGASGLKGRLVSRTITAPAMTTVPVYVTETKGSFVLTQVCTADADAGNEALISGSVLGLLATDRQTCRAYEPGVVFGPGETVSCVNTGNDFALVCTITGVQTK
jgi:hypothetical protein